MTITVLLEMAVPERREPISTFFFFFSAILQTKDLADQFSLNFGYFHYFFNDAFQEFTDVRLDVYFGYCFENLARASLTL